MATDAGAEIVVRRLGLSDVDVVVAAAHLFDDVPRRDWTERFVGGRDCVMFLAEIGGVAVGFLTGIEIVHPDKAPELLIYELGVDEPVRRKGVGRKLVDAAIDHAQEHGMRGMWVPFDHDNNAARATYRAAGGRDPESADIVNWVFTADR
jgi:ribosomal protein S18 acetylase RimI-like enzyme